jgi:periplasmic copper chaperone A
MKRVLVFSVWFFLLTVSGIIDVSGRPLFAVKGSKIEIVNAWIRPAAKGSNSAIYFVIRNKEEKTDTLLEADSKIAGDVMIHETYSKGNDMSGMRMLKFVVIPPKSAVKFKPQGLHVMLIDLKEDLITGQKKDFSLVFKRAGVVKVKATVRDTN